MDVNEQLLSLVMSESGKLKNLILGIDGLSRSGKTTLVKRVSSNLGDMGISHHVFHLDDHIVERSKRYDTGHQEWREYYSLQWDVEWLKVALFENLGNSQELELPFYNHELDKTILRKINVSGKKVFLIEGVFLMRPEWKDYYDFIIYLDCPKDVRFSRESPQTQSQIEKFKKRYWKAEEFYIETVRPVENADLIITCDDMVGK